MDLSPYLRAMIADMAFQIAALQAENALLKEKLAEDATKTPERAPVDNGVR